MFDFLTFLNFKNKSKLYFILLIIFSLAGIINSLYLYFNDLKKENACFIGNNCDLVTKSVYSKFLNIPLYFWGMFYYFLIFILVTLLFLKNLKIFSLLLITSLVGFLFSLRLTYLQFFTLKTICFNCILSAVFALLIFIFVILNLNFKKINKK